MTKIVETDLEEEVLTLVHLTHSAVDVGLYELAEEFLIETFELLEGISDKHYLVIEAKIAKAYHRLKRARKSR